jgi:hypothetical protein
LKGSLGPLFPHSFSPDLPRTHTGLLRAINSPISVSFESDHFIGRIFYRDSPYLHWFVRGPVPGFLSLALPHIRATLFLLLCCPWTSVNICKSSQHLVPQHTICIWYRHESLKPRAVDT